MSDQRPPLCQQYGCPHRAKWWVVRGGVITRRCQRHRGRPDAGTTPVEITWEPSTWTEPTTWGQS